MSKILQKKPISKGVAKVPVVMQMESMECGAAALGMVLAYYGKWIDLATLREDCGVSRDGQKLSKVAKTAEHYGLTYKAFRYRSETLFKEATFPCIAHWRGAHFVVVCGVRGNKVFVNDPALGHVVYSKKQFEENYTNMCMMFAPADDFEASGQKIKTGVFIAQKLKEHKKATAFVAMTTFIIGLIHVLQPLIMRIYADAYMTAGEHTLNTVIIFFILIAVLELVIGCISAVNRFRLFGFIAVKNDSSYMWHLFNLPEKFFFQREPGDLQQRKQSNSRISETLINLLIPLIFNGLMMVIYLVMMLRYSFRLAIIGIITLIINLALADFSAKKRLNIARVTRTDFSRLYSSTIGFIGMMDTIKASGAEINSFSSWADNQSKNTNDKYVYKKIIIRIKNLLILVNSLASCITVGVGLYLIKSGSMTYGMFMAFQGILTGFLSPTEQMIESNQQLNEMRTDIERVNDVMEYEQYHPFKEDVSEQDDLDKLRGHITLENVTFGYSPLEEPLIKNLSLEVKPGNTVAIVGKTGSGKSTVSSLVSGLYKPWSGEIRFDGKKMSEIPEKVFKESLSVVNQKIVLFNDSIENNLKMWNPYAENYEMLLAAKDADILDQIMEKPGGFFY
ncbi:MAG: ATP-binding cassette domain-containing protein, partial [Eubacterium sp.]|nr:ATP-binding cassette domain-containing protein [Eubacterium sp.]